MNEQDLLGLCILMEAGGEVDDGKAAVARVIKNRMAAKYESDGTIEGTVLKYDQFSWAWFAFERVVSGTGTARHASKKYVRVASTPREAEAVAEKCLATANLAAIGRCRDIGAKVFAGTYHGPLYDMLTDQALLYLNPDLLDHLPTWADPAKFLARIGHHDFYRA